MPTENTPSSEPDKAPVETPAAEPVRRGLGWPAAFVLSLFLVVASVVVVFVLITRQAERGARATMEVGRQGLDALQELARAFRADEVTTNFASYRTRVEGNNRLQFATIEQMELFERSESATAFWGQLELPRVVVEARAPVEYTYYLDLDGLWRFVLEDQTLTVRAPSIQFNSPAFDPSEIDYRIAEDSLLRDEQPVLDALRRGLGSMARQRAAENVDLVREMGRRKAEEFVERWLLASFGAESGDIRIRVLFADEDFPAISPDALRAPPELDLSVP